MDIVDRINNHNRSLAIISSQETATLLREAANEIERLRYALEMVVHGCGATLVDQGNIERNDSGL